MVPILRLSVIKRLNEGKNSINNSFYGRKEYNRGYEVDVRSETLQIRDTIKGITVSIIVVRMEEGGRLRTRSKQRTVTRKHDLGGCVRRQIQSLVVNKLYKKIKDRSAHWLLTSYTIR